MGKINIYVDDLRDCPDGFVVARNYTDAVVLLRENEVGVLSLDHDLGLDPNDELANTGYDLVKTLCYEGLRADSIYIHTDNPVGRDNMYYTLLRARERGVIEEDIAIFHYGCTPNKYSGSRLY